MSNVGMLDQVRSLVREHPEFHDQASYSCGTTACIAGWVVALDYGVRVGDNLDDVLFGLSGPAVAGRAQAILGLTVDEALSIFMSMNEDEALALVDAIIDRDKGELTDAGRNLLNDHRLSTDPAGDAP